MLSKKISRKKMLKHAQLTAFILLGLVILSIFLFVWYVRSQVQIKKAEKEIDLIAEVLQKTPVLNYYVTLCLKDSVESALILAGKQGGNIYLEQGGLTDRNSVPIFKYRDDNVTYGLTSGDTEIPNAPRLMEDPSYPMPPGYPCMQIIPAISYACTYDYLFPVQFYPFSKSHLPLLCMLGGPNDVAVGVYPFPCPAGSYGQNSIQQQIKVYAEKRMQNCTDFSAVRQMINFNITADPPEITPIMGENDVIVKATYPINITVGTYGSVRLLDFEVKIPVRMKRIYGLARFLADNDKTYLDFNITKDFDSDEYYNFFWDPYMRVEKFCPKCHLEGEEKDTTDILQINDSSSNIMGREYYFRFAVENRIPALDFIHSTSPEQEFDYIVQEGDEIIIEPMGHDPDDNDDLYYRYEGWKETYDEVFDPSCCKEIRGDAVVLCQENPWPCVKKAPAAVSGDCMDDINQEDLNMWTESDLHTMPNADDPSNIFRSANYTTKTTEEGAMPEQVDENPVHYPCLWDEEEEEWIGAAYSRDLGPHNITVKVCDRHDKCDWQSILVMVTDLPKPVIEVSNDYGPQYNYASLEDPFTLDASKSNIFALVDSYTWKDTADGAVTTDFEFTVAYAETDFGRIKIPHPFQEYGITTIKSAGNFFQVAGMHTLSLTIGSQTETKGIEVKECIPRSSSDPSYPYNTGSDPFMADHACCEPEGIYSDITIECYEDKEYGSMKYFDDDKYTVNDETLAPGYLIFWHLDVVTQFAPPLTGEYGNDVFYRRFVRSCSGDRGNICSGNAQEDIFVADSCSDLEYGWQDERCQGPRQGVFETISEAYCINYAAGQTFEDVEDVVGANGFCSDTPKCSDGTDYRNNGKYLCQKAVCEAGVCSKPKTDLCWCDGTCGSASKCSDLSFADLNNPEGGKCGGGGFCTSECQFYLPDNSIKACEVCSESIWIISAGSSEIDVRGNCCGDNDGHEIPSENEYYITGNDGTSACCDKKDTSGNFFGGGNDECVYEGVCTDTKVEPEICDGIDNDCDGSTDEDLGTTTCGLGVCEHTIDDCIAGVPQTCDPLEGASAEICNDEIDNDCDGLTDCVPGNEDDDCMC